jgi:ferredoxin
MATVIFKPDNITHEVENGSRLIDFCDEVGDVSLPFGCTEGSCGVCELTVLKGRENLSKITEEEENYLLPEDLQSGMRLGCQLTIRKGVVEIVWKKPRAKK